MVALLLLLGASTPVASGEASHARTVEGTIALPTKKNAPVAPPVCGSRLAVELTDSAQGLVAWLIEIAPQESDGEHSFSLLDRTGGPQAVDFDAWFYRGEAVCDPTIAWVPFMSDGDEYGVIPEDRSHVVILMAGASNGRFAFTISAHAVDPPAMPGAIRPGMLMYSAPTDSYCTLNFVFRDQEGMLFIGTAGHCVELGEIVVDAGRRAVGAVVFDLFGPDDTPASFLRDVALIRIDPSRYQDVEPSVPVWGGPTGYTIADDTGRGDVVTVYGHGSIYDYDPATRARRGIHWRDDAESYGAQLPTYFVDSGGPVLHAASGKALGIVSVIDPTPVDGHLLGPTIEHALVLLAEAGWNLEIVTAP